jgi:hypothetical protein
VPLGNLLCEFGQPRKMCTEHTVRGLSCPHDYPRQSYLLGTGQGHSATLHKTLKKVGTTGRRYSAVLCLQSNSIRAHPRITFTADRAHIRAFQVSSGAPPAPRPVANWSRWAGAPLPAPGAMP